LNLTLAIQPVSGDESALRYEGVKVKLGGGKIKIAPENCLNF